MLFSASGIISKLKLLFTVNFSNFNTFSIKNYKNEVLFLSHRLKTFFNYLYRSLFISSVILNSNYISRDLKKRKAGKGYITLIVNFLYSYLHIIDLNALVKSSVNKPTRPNFSVSKFNGLNFLFYSNLTFSFFVSYLKNSGIYTGFRFLFTQMVSSTKAYLYGFFIPRIVLPLILALAFFVFACLTYRITFLRVFGGWLLVLFFAYWLLSGFNHFLKRYKFGSFTSAIQRFWKRAYMCFWMIEGFMFFLFFYYTLNTSQEPSFMFDQVWFYNKQIWSIKAYMLTFSIIVSCILLLNILTLQMKFSTYRQSIVTLLISTLIFVYFLFGESYQFYYIVNFYDDCMFVFSPEEKVWELESDTPRTRTRNNYYTLTILARFWHYIFIFVGWVFFISKVIESKRIRYTFLSFNTQNFILFYILAWLSMSNWLKWTFRRFLDTPYYWFMSDYRQPLSGIFRNVSGSYLTSLTRFGDFFWYLVSLISIKPSAHYDYTMLSPYSFSRGTYLEYYLAQYL